jgi:hypothetical protein
MLRLIGHPQVYKMASQGNCYCRGFFVLQTCTCSICGFAGCIFLFRCVAVLDTFVFLQRKHTAWWSAVACFRSTKNQRIQDCNSTPHTHLHVPSWIFKTCGHKNQISYRLVIPPNIRIPFTVAANRLRPLAREHSTIPRNLKCLFSRGLTETAISKQTKSQYTSLQTANSVPLRYLRFRPDFLLNLD